MNSVPEEYTKSAPMTAMAAPGNPNAQYGADGTIKANKRHAADDPRVPVTVIKYETERVGNKESAKRYELTDEINHRYTAYDGCDDNITNDTRDKHRYQTHCGADGGETNVFLVIQLHVECHEKFKT